MPRKIRELKTSLRRAGFVERPRRGKGSHSWWIHDLAPGFPVNLSGQDGADAQPYQETQVRAALAVVEQAGRETQRKGE
jgi:hypothetical protein